MSRLARAAMPAIALALVWLGPARSTLASSVVEMTLPEMADHAGQAIVGTVQSVESYWAANPRRIESRVVFEQVEYLKGALADSGTMFELTVPGGTVGETRMQVCCAPQFAAGQKWVLFLLPEYQTYPVVGLYQGAFEIVEDPAGVERVAHTLHGVRHPILGLDDEGFVRVGDLRALRLADRVKHTSNLRIVEAPVPGSEFDAMTLEELVEQVQPILAASRDYSLTSPAGRWIAAERPGVPLKSVEAEELPHRTDHLLRVGRAQPVDGAAKKRDGE